MHHTVYSSTKQKAGLCTVSSLLSSVCCLLFDYCSSTVCLLSVYPSSTVRLLSVYSLSTVRLLFVYSLSTLCLLFIDCLSTFQVPSQTGCSPSLLCTDGAHRCWGTQKSSSKGRLSRRQGMKQRMPQAWLRVPSVSEPCMLTLLTCPSWCIHTRSSKWCLSKEAAHAVGGVPGVSEPCMPCSCRLFCICCTKTARISTSTLCPWVNSITCSVRKCS